MTLTFIIHGPSRKRQWQLSLWLLLMGLGVLAMLLWSLVPKAEAQPAGQGGPSLAEARWQQLQQQLAQVQGELAGLRVRAELLSRQQGLGPLKLDDSQGELVQLDQAFSLLESWQGRLHMPSIGQPLTSSRKASGFGFRQDPFTGKRRWHGGLDMSAKAGTPVLASAGGIVTFAGSYAGYGLLVEIDHGGGMVTRYGHNSALLVKRGDKIAKGQTIAQVGQSGRATGPHLHFEVLAMNQPQNPAHFVYRPGGL
ncbi:M23 family metallopeptidase [Gallaecimonas xiamenensis]|uniref:Peptidase M23B n=1 Tax=Gallaecimonas xiamenensis 3-C-1 TaxID=745411 RepID=K2J8A6_9GAMM|nr:M23 family metallopeptidase [Gallaecimonas xiamenensis]EKE71443.1 peptidase M23B [Gallaecimonas xiamenensis 3-C-1]